MQRAVRRFPRKMIDKTDRKIILELQNNGRASYASLASKLQISVSTVRRRLKRLIKNEIVKITAIPEPSKVGYPAGAFIAMDVDVLKIDDVCAKLAAYPNVHFTAVVFGRYDVVISVVFPSFETVIQFIKEEIARIDGVKQVESFILAELKKRTFSWFPADTDFITSTRARKK
jgi:Lrp/AsnC family transcriptional regulator for asnA, asnC and gidA